MALESSADAAPDPAGLQDLNILAAQAETLFDRLYAETELRAAHAHLDATLRALPDLLFEVDADGRIWNCRAPEASEFYIPPTQFLGKQVREVLPAETAEPIMEAIARTAESGQRAQSLYTLDYADGRRWYELSVATMAAESAPARFIALARDITERMRMDEELRQAQTRWQVLVEASPVPILSMDTEMRVLSWNAAAERVFGWSADEVVGKRNPSIPREDWERGAPSHHELRARLLHGESVSPIIVRRQRKDGALLDMEVSMAPLLDAAGRLVGFLSVAADVTERRRLEQQLLQAQKMEAVGRLAGGVAHDFNNLLTIMSGYTDLALHSLEAAHPARHDLSQIQAATQRASNLTRQLLLFSRRLPMEMKDTRLDETVQNMLKMLQRLIGEDVRVVAETPAETWPVLADAGQIEQVIMNLAVNARDAMPAGGRLTIRLDNMTLDTLAAEETPEARAGRFTRLTVADSGAGMSQNVLSHIFEPFFTTKAAGHGTGLGLSVVYSIVKQHDGWITVRSAPGQGTTFEIFLPAQASAPAARPDEATLSWEALRGSGQRILLVEDDIEVRGIAARILRDNGYTVAEAGDVAEALTAFENAISPYHLVLSDVVLPGAQTGLDLADELRRRAPALPIILASGYLDDRAPWRLLRQKGYPFLQKPYDPEKLLRAVKELLA
jgi:PAS domain S-box-containing protein